MKICFVDRFLDRKHGGGSMYTVDVLASALSESGNKVGFLAVDSAKNLFSERLSELPYHLHNTQLSSHQDFLKLPGVMGQLEREYDIFHLVDPYLAPYFGLYKKTGGNSKAVCSLNGYFFCTNYSLMDGKCHKTCNFYHRALHSDNPGYRKPLSLLSRLAQEMILFPNLEYVDHFYPDSPAVKKIYSEFGIPEAKMTVIPELIDFSRLGTPPKSRSFPVEKGKFKLLFVGRLVKSKAPHLIISAMEKLEESVTLTVCGNGPELEPLKHLAKKLGLQKRVSFEGYVDYCALPDYFKTHDLFVHPGLWPEPFGRTIVESIYLGLPVLASNVGAPPWIIGNSGITFQRGDVEDLTKKLSALVGNPEQLSTLSKSGEERAKRFDGETIFKKQLKEYEKLLSPASGSD